MAMDYTLVCIVIIVMIGIAISIYSMCKGCSGLQERGMTARTFFTPTTVIVQQLRARHANSGDPYTISGCAVQDKNPPLYEELFAPPPSYEETLQMIKAMSDEAKAKVPPPTPHHAGDQQVTVVIQPQMEQSTTTAASNTTTEKAGRRTTTTTVDIVTEATGSCPMTTQQV